jgi:hypothetical protein
MGKYSQQMSQRWVKKEGVRKLSFVKEEGMKNCWLLIQAIR